MQCGSPGGRAIVAGRQDAAIAHDHRTDLGAQTGRALRDLLRDSHEVLVPARTLVALARVGHFVQREMWARCFAPPRDSGPDASRCRVFLRLLLDRRCGRRGNRERHRAEGHDEQCDRRPCREAPQRIQRSIDVGGDRMARGRMRTTTPPRTTSRTRKTCRAKYGITTIKMHPTTNKSRDRPMAASEQRVDHVAAIELAGRQKVERGDENARAIPRTPSHEGRR